MPPPPYYEYAHRTSMVPGDGCSAAVACDSAITGLAFYTGGSYPSLYDGALFFADYARNAIFVMPKGQNGLPDPAAAAPSPRPPCSAPSLRCRW